MGKINDRYKGILGLNTGTGGGGYEECSYDVSLFIDDFLRPDSILIERISPLTIG